MPRCSCACLAPGPSLADIYEGVDPQSILGPTGAERELVNKQGLRLKAYYLPAASPRAVLLFVHGHGDHFLFELLRVSAAGKAPQYEGSWAQALNAAGISVCGIDNQGCGRSEARRGKRFYVERFNDYVDDILQFARSLDNAPVPGFKGLPRFICGGSLGGCITYCAIQQEGQLFQGAVLLAPMLSLEQVSRKGINPCILPLASCMSTVWPSGQLITTSLKDLKRLFPELYAELVTDPLLIGQRPTRVRNAVEYLRACEQVMAGMEAASFPFIVFASERDSMCDCEGSKQLYRRAKSADKQLRLVNDMWHILTKEPGNEKLLAEIVAWVLARSGTIEEEEAQGGEGGDEGEGVSAAGGKAAGVVAEGGGGEQTNGAGQGPPAATA